MATSLMLYEWGSAIAKLFETASLAMYIEFENNGGAAVTPPTPARDEGASYYASLSSSPVRDYLRVAMATVLVDSSDEDLYPEGNRVTFLAQTTGTTGVHGKSFSSGSSSRIYGGAVALVRDSSDPTQDLIICRFYFDAADQIVKPAAQQLIITHKETYK